MMYDKHETLNYIMVTWDVEPRWLMTCLGTNATSALSSVLSNSQHWCSVLLTMLMAAVELI